MAAVIAFQVNRSLQAFAIREKIGTILTEELANQRVIATGIGNNPILWDARIYTQRRLPIGVFAEAPDNSTLNGRAVIHIEASGASEDNVRPKSELTQGFVGDYTISCYGYGKAQETDTGHDPTDVVASTVAESTASLVYNILRNAKLSILDMKGIVQQRTVSAFMFSNPNIDHPEPSIYIECIQMKVNVTYIEHVQENAGVPLQQVHLDVHKEDVDGQLLLTATILPTGS